MPVIRIKTVVSRTIFFQFKDFFFSMFSPADMSRSWTYKNFVTISG